jgi:hypothetical protein
MPTPDAFRWFKTNFAVKVAPAVAATPFTLDLVAAIAAQETGHIWGRLRETLAVADILDICVGDTLDADRGRSAFPRLKADLVARPRGQEMFDIARDALVKMSSRVPGFAGAVSRPDKFCHGFGIFQVDLQFFLKEPEFFLERQWRSFDVCLARCVAELTRAKKAAGLADRTTLTDLERVHVAIAYNTGTFKPAKGLQQGFFDGQRFYGEQIFDFLRVAQTVSTPAAPAVVAAPPPGSAVVSPPTAVASTGRLLQVDAKESPLRLRSEPRIDKANPTSNVIARLPDGHLVREVSRSSRDTFTEVETSLNGAHFQGFAASAFLVPAPAASRERSMPRPMVPAAAVAIPAVFAPTSSPGRTRRTTLATALSLDEPNPPGREGTTPEELRDELNAIVDYLAVDKPSHIRYQPGGGATFCNIYAHDYCHLAGVYLPRVWWSGDAIARLATGEAVEPRLGRTIDEQRANDLFRWLRDFGAGFGWRQTGTLTKLQTEANAGAVALIIARRVVEGRSGHITLVIPEAVGAHARRDRSGDVIAPLQTQAGARNFRRGTGPPNWWKGEQFADSAFWIHA